MPLAVRLPKTVLIQNRRLAILHFSMMASLLVGLLYYEFYLWRGHYGQVSVVTALEVQWDENAAIDGMQEFMARNPDLEELCLRAPEEEVYVTRWDQNWTRQYTCAKMCNLYDYLSHETRAAKQNETSCWSSFKDFGLNQKYTPLQFMESRGRRDVSVITSKSDWYVDHAALTNTNYLEVVPQVKAAVLELGYTYRVVAPPPYFPGSSQHKAPLDGDAQNARTLILDAAGHPVGSPIPAGDPIRISMDDLWLYAERTDDEAAQPLTYDVMGTGAEVRATAACFGDDRHLREFLAHNSRDDYSGTGDYGASLHDLVCAIRFKQVSYNYQIHASFDAPSSAQGEVAEAEVLSETVGISIKVLETNTFAEMWDLNALLLQITSIMVLLAVPLEVTNIITTRMLGPLSAMYKRVIVEPYDIEEVAATTSTVLAQNIASFYQLSEVGEEGTDIIKLQALQVLMQRAFAHRSHVINERELLALASFVYDGLSSKTIGSEGNNTLLGLFFDVELGRSTHEESTNVGITLDQWNQCRLDCEKITFEALVKLFDKDRRRYLFERMFTPKKIQEALRSAMDEGDESLGFASFGTRLFSSSSPSNQRPLQLLHQSSLLGRKVKEYFSGENLKQGPRMGTELYAEFAKLSERVRVMEEAMAGSSRLVANEADGPSFEDSQGVSFAIPQKDTDALTQLPSASALGSASFSALSASPQMRLPAEAQPSPSPTDSPHPGTGSLEREGAGSSRAKPLADLRTSAPDMASTTGPLSARGGPQSPEVLVPAPPAAAAADWPQRTGLPGAASGSVVHDGQVLPQHTAPARRADLNPSQSASESSDITSLTTARDQISTLISAYEQDLTVFRAQRRHLEGQISEAMLGKDAWQASGGFADERADTI